MTVSQFFQEIGNFDEKAIYTVQYTNQLRVSIFRFVEI
jgi:hypothetical protein